MDNPISPPQHKLTPREPQNHTDNMHPKTHRKQLPHTERHQTPSAQPIKPNQRLDQCHDHHRKPTTLSKNITILHAPTIPYTHTNEIMAKHCYPNQQTTHNTPHTRNHTVHTTPMGLIPNPTTNLSSTHSQPMNTKTRHKSYAPYTNS